MLRGHPNAAGMTDAALRQLSASSQEVLHREMALDLDERGLRSTVLLDMSAVLLAAISDDGAPLASVARQKGPLSASAASAVSSSDDGGNASEDVAQRLSVAFGVMADLYRLARGSMLARQRQMTDDEEVEYPAFELSCINVARVATSAQRCVQLDGSAASSLAASVAPSPTAMRPTDSDASGAPKGLMRRNGSSARLTALDASTRTSPPADRGVRVDMPPTVELLTR